MIANLLQYGFIVRGLEAGIVVALIAPLIGVFLVLRRYSLIADTLSHVSLAGIALGFIFAVNPIITGLAIAVLASLGIERLRISKKVYGESALALFLSGSLALAIVLLSFSNGLNANLFNYLFGSIVTVTQNDVYLIVAVAILVATAIFLFYKDLIFITFDEDVAKVSGIKTNAINTLLIVLSAFTVAISIPIVGVLLISALIVVPVVTALQLRKSFTKTLIWAEIISVASVIFGIIASFYLNTSTGGTIVLLMLSVFAGVFLWKSVKISKP